MLKCYEFNTAHETNLDIKYIGHMPSFDTIHHVSFQAFI